MHAVLLTFDRLPARFLGCYGAEQTPTPNFDQLAAAAFVFDQHFCTNADPGTAAAAWQTGRHQPRPADAPDFISALHKRGVRTVLLSEAGAAFPRSPVSRPTIIRGQDGLDVLPDDTPFARLIRAAGEHLRNMCEPGAPPTLLWLHSRGVARPWLPPRAYAIDALADAGLLDEDDDVAASSSSPRPVPANASLPTDDAPDDDAQSEDTTPSAAASTSPETLDADLEAILATLIDRLDRRAFHTPSGDPLDFETLVQTARAVYAGYVSMLDDGLGRLLEALDALPDAGPLLFIVTAALGESLGETVGLGQRLSEFEHGSRLASEVTHTPLIVQIRPDAPRAREEKGTGSRPMSESAATMPFASVPVPFPSQPLSGRTNALVQSIDLAPTLLEWFDASAERFPCDGASLRSLVHGGAAPREFICFGDEPCHAIRTPDRLLVSAREPDLAAAPAAGASAHRRLYLLPEDRWQINDVAAQSPDDVERLEQQLQEFSESLRDASS